MRDQLRALNQSSNESCGARLQVRNGINTGEVMAGDPSGGHGFVTGEAVALGKRLEQAAEPGEILIGEETWHCVAHGDREVGRASRSPQGKASRGPRLPA